MDVHIEKMKARAHAELESKKQERLTQVLNLLIAQTLTEAELPILKEFDEYQGREWLQTWDHLNQNVIDSAYHKLQQFHQIVHTHPDLFNQSLEKQLRELLTRYQNHAEEFRDQLDDKETHRAYCELHNTVTLDILPLITTIFNNLVGDEDENEEEDEALAMGLALSEVPPLTEDEQLSVATAMSMPSPRPLPKNKLSFGDRIRQFFASASASAPSPPPKEASSSEDEAAKKFRDEFW